MMRKIWRWLTEPTRLYEELSMQTAKADFYCAAYFRVLNRMRALEGQIQFVRKHRGMRKALDRELDARRLRMPPQPVEKFGV